jgi:thiosulfate/3-mercaptopyruvate sulfurtransferase
MQGILETGIRNVPISTYRLLFQLLILATFLVSLASVSFATDLGLIEATALKSNPAQWVMLDSRPRAEWEGGHIQGAISFNWESYTRTDAKGVKYSSLPPQELAAVLAELGIDENTPMVVYGDADKSWGSEGYTAWLLTWLGHKGPVRLLNGGIQSWRAQNLPLVKGQEKPAARKAGYKVNLNSQYSVSTEDIQSAKGAYSLVDVRSTFEWIKGRIPGAVHIPWDDFYTGKDRHPLPPADLKKLLIKHGVDTSKPVVYYCLGGVRSAFAWTVHQLSGLPNAKNYKGSWAACEKRSGQ